MLYRRAHALIAYWNHGGLAVRNYARNTRIRSLTAEALAVLNASTHWRSERELVEMCPTMTRDALAATLAQLIDAGLVQRSDAPGDLVEDALDGWSAWGPSASFFHLDTKDVEYVDRSTNAARADRRLLVDPPPPRDEGDVSIELPAFTRRGPFPEVLLARRSWRRFGRRALTLAEVSTVLGLTWGTQRWMHLREDLACPLKTSPSGGASHSLEVFVLVRNVRDLTPAVYRYAPDAHGLTRVGDVWTAEEIGRSLGGQAWASSAGAIFFMTAVFSRIQWKYKFARAYRAVLLEAGHFCQTFCLVATWLKLAPFCTAALRDTMIERSLGADGVTESVVYAMGIGPRPAGVAWAPWPDEASLPRTTDPAHLSRRRPVRRRGSPPTKRTTSD